MVREVDEVDEDDVESGDAFTWLASGTDVTSDAPAGTVFAIAREAGDRAEAGEAGAAEAAFARAAALAVTLGEAALLTELADVVATTLAPLDPTRSLALLRRWQGDVDALDQAERQRSCSTRVHTWPCTPGCTGWPRCCWTRPVWRGRWQALTVGPRS